MTVIASRTGVPVLSTGVSKVRYAVIISASAIIMLCAGSVYAWSIFVAPLKTEFGFSTTQTQIVFGLIVGIFTIGMLFINKVLRKYGPRISAAIGAIFFSLGYLVAALSNGNLVLIILGISVLSGIGMAFGYVTVLNNLVRWFPDNKGLATGLAVSGFGGGAIMLSQIARPLLSSGWEVLDIFRIVSIVYGVVFLAASLVLSVPPHDQPKLEESRVNTGKLLRDKRFWVLFYVFFAGSFAGMLFSGNLKPLGQSYGISETVAVLAISLLSIGNAAGRIFWGQLHDLIGGKKSVTMALTLLTVFTLMLLVSREDLSFVILALIIGLNFGSNFVNYAADVSDIWGIARLDIIYPAVSVAYGIAGIIGPVAGGMISDITGTYYYAIILSAVVCASGILVYSRMKPEKRIQKLKAPGMASVRLSSSSRPG